MPLGVGAEGLALAGRVGVWAVDPATARRMTGWGLVALECGSVEALALALAHVRSPARARRHEGLRCRARVLAWQGWILRLRAG